MPIMIHSNPFHSNIVNVCGVKRSFVCLIQIIAFDIIEHNNCIDWNENREIGLSIKGSRKVTQ
jgi:hypothetical protein